MQQTEGSGSAPADAPGVEGFLAGTVSFSAVDGPGSRYVVFLQGCGWDCLACHNPDTIVSRPVGLQPSTVEQVLAPIVAAAPFLTGVTVTGGEPTQQPDFLCALLRALAEHPATSRLDRLLDSNGAAPLEVWDRVLPLVDGVMLDLKSIDAERHIVLTGHSNRRPVQALARTAAVGKLTEVRLLLVPGVNDDAELLTRTAHWLLSLDPQIHVRVTGFRRYGTRACARELLEVDDADRDRYRAVLTAAGIEHLAIG